MSMHEDHQPRPELSQTGQCPPECRQNWQRASDPLTHVAHCPSGADAPDEPGHSTVSSATVERRLYTHQDVMDAFQKGLLLAENARAAKAPGYAEGYIDGWFRRQAADEVFQVEQLPADDVGITEVTPLRSRGPRR